MEATSTPTNTNYQQITVEVPEDRVAEFHAFFARFLAGRPGRGRRGRYGGQHHRGHGRRCGERRAGAEQSEATPQQPAPTTEI
jgi:hypothetical protein